MKLTSAISTSAFKAPKLPVLNAAQRVILLSHLITTQESIDALLAQDPGNEAALNIQCAFEVAVSSLLDGCETVEEYLKRDTSVKYSNIGGFVVGEENGTAFFVCPNCNTQTSFPATKENMDCIRESSILDCCPVCTSEKLSAKQKLGRIIFGGEV